MKHVLHRFFLCSVLLLSLFGVASAEAPQGWELIFNDEFKTPKLNPAKWVRVQYDSEKGNPDWRKKQSRDKGLVTFSKKDSDGHVILWGKKGTYSNCESHKPKKDTYACGGIFSQNCFAFQYGYVEVRARFDCANAAWPAIWLLPSGKGGLGGWPAGGEIDMLEHLNHDSYIYQTLHMTGNRGKAGSQMQDKEGWHIYAMEWGPGYIKLMFDGKVTGDFKKANYPSWPFDAKDNEFYLLLDQQLGGAWVGHNYEDAILTKKGAGFHIDYVRVYGHPEGTFTRKAKDKKAKDKKKKNTRKSESEDSHQD